MSSDRPLFDLRVPMLRRFFALAVSVTIVIASAAPLAAQPTDDAAEPDPFAGFDAWVSGVMADWKVPVSVWIGEVTKG